MARAFHYQGPWQCPMASFHYQGPWQCPMA